MLNDRKLFLFFVAVILGSLACGVLDYAAVEKNFVISGYVWIDENQNGIYDQDENPAEGIEVNLIDQDGEILQRVRTDSKGKYFIEYSAPPDDEAQLEFNLPDGWSFTIKDAGDNDDADSDVYREGDMAGKTDLIRFGSFPATDAGIIAPAPVAVEPTPIPATPEPEEKPNFIFTPEAIWVIDHGTGMSYILIDLTVQDQDNNPVEEGSATGTLTLPDGKEVSQTAEINSSGTANFEFEIYQYGEYPFRVDEIADHAEYRPELNFATDWIIPVDSQEGEPYFPAGSVGEFYEGFNQAFQQQDTTFLYERLHPAVLEQFGPELCHSYLDSVIANQVEANLIGVTDFGNWDWQVGDETIQIPNTYTASVEMMLPDGSYNSQLTHLALNPETQQVNWFTYCDQ